MCVKRCKRYFDAKEIQPIHPIWKQLSDKELQHEFELKLEAGKDDDQLPQNKLSVIWISILQIVYVSSWDWRKVKSSNSVNLKKWDIL